MKVAVHQPSFLPWVGYWNKYAESDLFIFYAGIQYDEDNGNRVKMNGSWATVPIQSGAKQVPMYQVTIPQMAPIRKIAKTIRQCYMTKAHPFRLRLQPIVDVLESWDFKYLIDIDLMLHNMVRDALGLKVRERLSLDHLEGMDAEARLDELFDMYANEKVTYLSGSGGRRYMDESKLTRVNEVLYQNVPEGTVDQTVLEIIARHEDPLTVVREAMTWSK